MQVATRRATNRPSPRDEDASIVARATAACGLWTVRVGKRGDARKRGGSGWGAPIDCRFTMLGRGRCRSRGAKNDCGGKHKLYPD